MVRETGEAQAPNIPESSVAVRPRKRRLGKRAAVVGSVALAGAAIGAGVFGIKGDNGSANPDNSIPRGSAVGLNVGEPGGASIIQEPLNTSAEFAHAEIDPHSLRAVFDSTTNTTFVVDSQGNVVRTIEPPGIVKNALTKEQGFEAEVLWGSIDRGIGGMPWILIMKTQDGERIEKELDFANRVKVEVDNSLHP